jgi:hypothetical protein
MRWWTVATLMLVAGAGAYLLFRAARPNFQPDLTMHPLPVREGAPVNPIDVPYFPHEREGAQFVREGAPVNPIDVPYFPHEREGAQFVREGAPVNPIDVPYFPHEREGAEFVDAGNIKFTCMAAWPCADGTTQSGCSAESACKNHGGLEIPATRLLDSV